MLGYHANIPRLRARRTLWMYQFSQNRPSGEGIYHLTLAITGSKTQAEKAEQDWIRAKLRAGETPT